MNDDVPHLEILPQTQRNVLAELGKIADRDEFYLAGGTAVALHLGHRRSIDFDWFTEGDLDDPQRYAARLRSKGVAWNTRQTAPGTLHGSIDEVKVSFLSYHYPLIDEPTPISGYACQMASLDDLACMKLAAVAQRGSKKDFVDIWALANHGFHLERMVALYQQKYATQDISHVVASLSYFDDADPEPMPYMLVDVDWKAVRADLRRRVKDFAG
jgi:hypothetical protein